MKQMILGIIAIVGLIGLSPISTNAQDVYNTKVLLHGTKSIAESSNWGLSGWLVLPNPGAQVIVAVAGPRYEVANKWSLEVMAGTFSKQQEGQLLIDIRASYDAFDPAHFWTNIEYFTTSRDWYVYFDVNVRIGKLGLLGLETENMFNHIGDNDLSFGPRVVLPFNDRLVMIGAYQFHNGDNPNQVWTRAVLNF